MKLFKRSIATLMVLMLVISVLTLGISADTQTRDGLTVTLTTDKESYNAGEDITATLTVTNNNETAMETVTLKQLIPEGYELAEGQESEKTVNGLNAGDTVTLTVRLVAVTEAEDDSFNLMEFYREHKTLVHIAGIVLGVIVLIALIALGIHKLRYSFISLFLCAVLLWGAVSGTLMQVKALEPIEGSISVSAVVTADGQERKLEAAVDYSMVPEETTEAVCTVTFDTLGGSEIPKQTVTMGECAAKPTNPTKEGFIFAGWYTDAELTDIYSFSSAVSSDLVLYACWEEKTDADAYYANNAQVLDVIHAEHSKDTYTEADVKVMLESKGFADYPITYDYSIDGGYHGEQAILHDSTEKHPVYQTYYVSKNHEVWCVFVINGEVFANPISFNLVSDLHTSLVVSASEVVTSYDNDTNKFYLTIPNDSAIIVENVDQINADTLDELSIEKLCQLSGATPLETETEEEQLSIAGTESFASAGGYAFTEAGEYMDDTDDPIIIVSLGDSYSSGEGIPPFYGQFQTTERKVMDEDWLAHRSTTSWPSRLMIPGITGDKTLADYRVDWRDGEVGTKSIQWYFAATSGAETKHLNSSHNKPYHQKTSGWGGSDPIVGDYDLPPQLQVFDVIDGTVDIVTMTIGGNDVDFAGVIETAAKKNKYFIFGKNTELKTMLDDLWENIETTMGKIKDAYEDVQQKAGTQAAILVAGYPKLIDESGIKVLINKQEAAMINEKVTAFNERIEKLVNECRADGMNIHFVDVEREFEGHSAYAKKPWINSIIIPAQAEDLEDNGITSNYSVHPNSSGAQAYARCVNAKIQEIWTSEIIGTVSDIDGVVAGATVEIISMDRYFSEPYTTQTDRNGDFKVSDVPRGVYEIKVCADGYENKSVYITVHGIIDRNHTDEVINLDDILLVSLYQNCDITGIITIADTDTDMTNNLPLEGAEITIEITGYMEKVATSGEHGEYTLTDIPYGTFNITVTKEGYIPVTETLVVGQNDEEIVFNITIEAVSNEYRGVGYASGTIFDTRTGMPVRGMTLYVRNGIDNTTGDVIQTIHMNDHSDEYITTVALEAGNYTVQVIDEREGISDELRYSTASFNIKILGGMTIGNQHGFVSNNLVIDEMRVVLSWGATPRDLDSHMYGFTSAGDEVFHVYYLDKSYDENGEEIVNLDVDDTTSYGPETVTVYSMDQTGKYSYYIHDFTNRDYDNSTALSSSGASVTVYIGDTLVATYYVPATKSGNVWHVFDYDAAAGKIIAVNTVSGENLP